MSRWLTLFQAFLLLVSAAAAQQSSRTSPSPDSKPTLMIIPHIHWEGAVFKTREEYLEMGLPYILEGLNLLKRYPEYRFVLDQTAYVKPFLERYPEQVDLFRKFLDEGRLQLAGGAVTMMDVNMPSGESYVRHMIYGKRYYRDELGHDPKVGWGLDTFGHHPQMPQLLKLAGYNSYWFQRGPGNDMPFAFLWEGIDGTRIPAFWLAQTYVDFFRAPGNLLEFSRFARSRYRNLDPYTDLPVRVAMAGWDVEPPEAHLPAMVRRFNEQADAPLKLKFAVPSEFEEALAEHGEPPVYKRDLNPVFQGVYSSRIEVKQWMRELEGLLTSVETFAAIARRLGVATDEEALANAWDPVLFNQAHDIAAGVMVDKVYDDTKRGFQYARQVGGELLESYLQAVGERIDTRGEGIPVAVFNTLGWARTDFVEVQVGFTEPGVVNVDVLSPSGEKQAIQLSETERYDDGGIRQAKVAFVARDVPAQGWSVFRILPRTAGEGEAQELALEPARWAGRSSHRDFGSIENEFYSLTFNLWTGAITKLIHKPTNWEVLGGRPANIVAAEPDGGDFWELYGNLNGARLVAMESKHGLPEKEGTRFSNDTVGGNGTVLEGPVFSQFSVQHPLGSGSFATRVRLYQGVPRIDIQTRLLNNEKFLRYRVLFPTSIRDGKNTHEIPFGSLQRPVEQEFPAQNWADYSDGSRGVALLNRGLPGNNVADGTLMLSLMRSARIQAYAFHGGFEPGVSSDGGLEIGKPLTFDYSLVPHAGDWREARIYRAGWEFNRPFLVRKQAKHAGTLPPSWGALKVSHPNVVVSALKPGPAGSTILRVYEASGRDAEDVTIEMLPKLASAVESNLLEDAGENVELEGGILRFGLSPYQIKTFRLQLSDLND